MGKTMSHTVLAEIAGLDKLCWEDLQHKWEEMFGSKPPTYNKSFLIKRITYRYQELAFGGLNKDIKDRLNNYTSHYVKHGNTKSDPPIFPESPLIGTVMVREYHDIKHRVTVLQDGFEYNGCKYKTLSAAARAITGGIRVSGPVFFNLKKTERSGLCKKL